MMASDRAQASGLPQRRDEYWKYTRPDAFVQADVTLHASQRSSLRSVRPTRHNFGCI